MQCKLSKISRECVLSKKEKLYNVYEAFAPLKRELYIFPPRLVGPLAHQDYPRHFTQKRQGYDAYHSAGTTAMAARVRERGNVQNNGSKNSKLKHEVGRDHCRQSGQMADLFSTSLFAPPMEGQPAMTPQLKLARRWRQTGAP